MSQLRTLQRLRRLGVISGLSCVAALLSATSVASATTAGECEPQWIPTFGEAPGTDDSVECMAVFDDGSGGGEALYIGGDFQQAGGVSVFRLAKWDGTQWSNVGGGVSGTVRALAVYDDGTGPALYVGGTFSGVGGPDNTTLVNALAKWNGEEWSLVGTGFASGFVWSLKVFDDGTGPALYVGGFFTEVGGVPANRIAKWDGTSWSALGGGMASGPGGQVRALEVFDDGSGNGPQLYAAGSFLEADGNTVNRVARWNHVTQTWSGLGDGLNSHVWDLEVFDDGFGSGPTLYAGGEFRFSGSTSVERIAKWNPTTQTWSAVSGGVNGTVNVAVRSMVVYDAGGQDALHVAGNFTEAGGVPIRSFAKWDGVSWSELGVGMNGPVKALAIYNDGTGDAIFAGGSYIGLGTGWIVDRMLKWDGQDWYPVGSGLTSAVRAIEIFDDGTGDGPALYAAGLFVSGNGESLLRIARWNGGTSWTGLGGGVTGGTTIWDLAVLDSGSGPELYAAGNITLIGGQTVNRIAKWNPMTETWSNVGSGIDGTVYAMEVWDDGSGPALYVVGNFTAAGGVATSRIAKWNGSAWSAVGGGLSNTAGTLIVHDDGTGPALFVGGGFGSAGGIVVNGVAKWDGKAWSALGEPVPGVTGYVTGLGVYDDGSGTGEALYVSFDAETTGGGVVVNRIAKWDGNTWSALGSGLNHTVSSMDVYDDGTGDGPALFVGGAFTSAGGQPADYIAKWNGATWQELAGGGVQGTVMVVRTVDDVTIPGNEDGPSLFVGGWFLDSPAGDSYLAKWNGCADAPVPGDLTGDGVVNLFDLLDLLAAWGSCPGACPPSCAADFTNSAGTGSDCTVNLFDLLFLLANWG